MFSEINRELLERKKFRNIFHLRSNQQVIETNITQPYITKALNIQCFYVAQCFTA